LPNVGPYIYDVSISGFTRSSIYIYDISSLRVKVPNVIDAWCNHDVYCHHVGNYILKQKVTLKSRIFFKTTVCSFRSPN